MSGSWSKHANGFRAPEVVAELERDDPTTDVDLLREAANDIRSSSLNDRSPEFANALARAMDQIARVLRMDHSLIHRIGHAEVVEAARQWLNQEDSDVR
jgi:hypothetical protein